MLSHLAIFRERFLPRFLAGSTRRGWSSTAPTTAVKDALAASGPRFMSPLAGFER
jgi:hypothetical protein